MRFSKSQDTSGLYELLISGTVCNRVATIAGFYTGLRRKGLLNVRVLEDVSRSNLSEHREQRTYNIADT
jgi:hypothetical protein